MGDDDLDDSDDEDDKDVSLVILSNLALLGGGDITLLYLEMQVEASSSSWWRSVGESTVSE